VFFFFFLFQLLLFFTFTLLPTIFFEVIHEKAAEKARQAGIFVVMDRCILKEHRARSGVIRSGG